MFDYVWVVKREWGHKFVNSQVTYWNSLDDAIAESGDPHELDRQESWAYWENLKDQYRYTANRVVVR